MKAVLMSIQSKWLSKILNGEKTIEIRKSIPKDFVGWVYLYCTKAKPYLDRETKLLCNAPCFTGENDLNGKVVAKFTLDKVDKIKNLGSKFYIEDGETYTNFIAGKSCLDFYDLKKYASDKDLYAWYIKNLEILDKPKELRDFYNYKFYQTLYSSFNFGIKNDGLFNKNLTFEDYIKKFDDFVKIKSAPQSWMYVEVVE